MAVWTQLFPPTPSFTEAQLPPLTNKVFIVTGGNSGVGLELCKMLYSAGGTVYIASRSPHRIEAAIETIMHQCANFTSTAGTLKPMILDLSDLSTIAPAVERFLAQEKRLDVLFNNAGISRQPPGSVTAQGHEIHMGTNCVGPFLLTKLLLPLLISTAQLESSPQNSVRIVFMSSGLIDIAGPSTGLSLAELRPGHHAKDPNHNYSASKFGNWALASEFDRRYSTLNSEKGIVSIALSPGTLRTPGWDSAPCYMKNMMKPFFHEPRMGAYTELWAGFSTEVETGMGRKFAIPWGRWNLDPKKRHLESLKGKDEGGRGVAHDFWEWCEEETSAFAR